MSKLRMAVIGAGRLGGFHAQKLAKMDGVDLAWVIDPDATQRNRVAAECGAKAVSDFRPLLDSIDAAVIAAPTMLHHELGMELLNRGIHVLMEKPLATTAAHADELVRAARRSGAVLQVGHVERFNPAFTTAQSHIQSPKYIEAVRASGFTFRSTDVGAVLDLMIHDIDLVLALVRSPLCGVEAMGLSVLGGHEDVANARLEFRNGCVAVLSASRVNYEPARRMQIWSLGGFASIDFASRKTTVVQPSDQLLRRRLDVATIAAEPADRREQILAAHLARKQYEHPAVDAIALELADFVDSIRTGRSPLASGDGGLYAVAIAGEILAQIDTHSWDDQPDGLIGPMAASHPGIIPSPHWHLAPSRSPLTRKEAG